MSSALMTKTLRRKPATAEWTDLGVIPDFFVCNTNVINEADNPGSQKEYITRK